jgi:hypothetical protein
MALRKPFQFCSSWWSLNVHIVQKKRMNNLGQNFAASLWGVCCNPRYLKLKFKSKANLQTSWKSLHGYILEFGKGKSMLTQMIKVCYNCLVKTNLFVLRQGLTLYARLAWNSKSSCLYLLNAEIIGVYHYTHLRSPLKFLVLTETYKYTSSS